MTVTTDCSVFATCAAYGQEMAPGQSCNSQTVTIAGHRYPRLRYGTDWPWRPPLKAAQPCHDCNVTHGQFHHISCDLEFCPRCGRQAISCGCQRSGSPCTS